MNTKQMKERLAIMDDVTTFASTEACTRIMDIASNADLGPRECMGVLIKASRNMLVSAFMAAMDDGMPPEMALNVIKQIQDRLAGYVPGEKQTTH